MARIIFVVSAGALPLLSGCQDTLFPEDAPRSPFARYQTLRGSEAPMTETDPYGNDQPALRARLAPLGQQQQ